MSLFLFKLYFKTSIFIVRPHGSAESRLLSALNLKNVDKDDENDAEVKVCRECANKN